eukprot:2106970-Prymnesium_polylepis.1
MGTQRISAKNKTLAGFSGSGALYDLHCTVAYGLWCAVRRCSSATRLCGASGIVHGFIESTHAHMIIVWVAWRAFCTALPRSESAHKATLLR